MLGRVRMFNAFLTYSGCVREEPYLRSSLLVFVCILMICHILFFFSFLKFRQWALGGRRASGMVLRSQGQTVLRSQADQAGFLQVTRWSAIAETK